jgi:hypothetical protein
VLHAVLPAQERGCYALLHLPRRAAAPHRAGGLLESELFRQVENERRRHQKPRENRCLRSRLAPHLDYQSVRLGVRVARQVNLRDFRVRQGRHLELRRTRAPAVVLRFTYLNSW